MAQTLETLIVRLQADVSGLRRELDRAVDNAERQTGKIESSFSSLGNTIKGALALGASLYAAQGFIRGLGALAGEAQRAENAVLVFNKQLQRSSVDVDQANKVVDGLSQRFGVLPTVVQEATTLLLRAGGSLEDVERALTAAGASAAAAGTDITRAFENVSVAVATGRSELLETSGIVANLGPAQQAYASSIGKTVEQLTEQELIQARVNAIFEESKSEIEDVDELLSGLTGQSARLNTALADLRVQFGEQILPAVTELVGAFAGLVDTLGDLGVWESLGGAIEDTTDRLVTAVQAVDAFFESLTNRELIVSNFRNLLLALNPFDVFQGQSEEDFFRQFGITFPQAVPTPLPPGLPGAGGAGVGGGGAGRAGQPTVSAGLLEFPSFAGSPAEAAANAAAAAREVAARAAESARGELERQARDALALSIRLSLNVTVPTPDGPIPLGDVPDFLRRSALRAVPGVREPGVTGAPLALAGGGITTIDAPALTTAISELEGATRESADILSALTAPTVRAGAAPAVLGFAGGGVTVIDEAVSALEPLAERTATLQQRFDSVTAGLESTATVLFDDLPPAVRGVGAAASATAVSLAELQAQAEAIRQDTLVALGGGPLPIPVPTVTPGVPVPLPVPSVSVTAPSQLDVLGETFLDNVLAAGTGFVDGILSAVQGGSIDQAFSVLITSLGQVLSQTVATAIASAAGGDAARAALTGDIAGAVISGLFALFALSAGGTSRARTERQEAAAASRARVPSAIRIDFTFNQTNSLGLIDDPATRSRLRDVSTEAFQRFEDVLKRNLVPRLEALEGRVFA